MAIIAKFTRTLPAPTATISGGFVFLLSAGWFTQANTGAAGSPIDGGTNSIANGGGDMQIFSDDTITRLPIEVVSFVTGGSPQCQVWVRTPSYTAGDTITIGKDDTQTTQPAVGAAFGRNAAWVDYAVVMHGGSVVDSTGGHTFTTVGSPTIVAGKIGDAFNVNNANYYTATPSPALQTLTQGDFSSQAWVKYETALFSSTGAIVGQGLSSSGKWWTFGFRSDLSYINTDDAVTRRESQNGFDMDTDGTNNTWYLLGNNVNVSADLELFTDGLLQSTTAPAAAGCESTKTLAIGGPSVLTGGPQVIQLSEIRVGEVKGLDFRGSEKSNQDDPDNFGTSSEYVLVGGSGISIAVTLGTIEYNSNDTTVGLAGSVDVTATLGAINYSSNDTSIQVSGDVNVIATLGAINYASNDTAISLAGNVDVTATLGAIDYSSNDASVSLLGGINVNATLGAIDYVSNDTTITLQGQIALITTLGTISYDSNNVIVQIGTGQIIGNVTAGFADNLYSAGFKPSEITVNFKT